MSRQTRQCGLFWARKQPISAGTVGVICTKKHPPASILSMRQTKITSVDHSDFYRLAVTYTCGCVDILLTCPVVWLGTLVGPLALCRAQGYWFWLDENPLTKYTVTSILRYLRHRLEIRSCVYYHPRVAEDMAL